LVNGEPVHADYRLASGDTLELVHHAGEKGACHGAMH
jgi:sulfur carrier protein ThiS